MPFAVASVDLSFFKCSSLVSESGMMVEASSRCLPSLTSELMCLVKQGRQAICEREAGDAGIAALVRTCTSDGGRGIGNMRCCCRRQLLSLTLFSRENARRLLNRLLCVSRCNGCSYNRHQSLRRRRDDATAKDEDVSQGSEEGMDEWRRVADECRSCY